MTAPVERGIETITDLVDFLLCADNDSPGCDYLRGWVGFLKGAPIQIEQVGALLFWLREDREVYDLVLRVAQISQLPPTLTVTRLINAMTKIYQQQQQQQRKRDQNDKGNNEAE